MQAKLRFSCHVWEPIKLANAMGATISASVQLFISSFLTHFHILMRWHSGSRIRTVGCIIVCLIWRYACCQRRYRVCTMEMECWWVLHVHTSPHPKTLISDSARRDAGTAMGCVAALSNFVSLVSWRVYRTAGRFFSASPFAKIDPRWSIQEVLHNCGMDESVCSPSVLQERKEKKCPLSDHPLQAQSTCHCGFKEQQR